MIVASITAAKRKPASWCKSRHAERFLNDLKDRLAAFALSLHPEKTRLIEFGRYAAERRAVRGLGKPETFNFLGLTHYCSTEKGGTGFQLGRKTRRTVRRKHGLHPTGGFGLLCKEKISQPWQQDSNR